jgi:N-acetyl sugar amidotransferase
MPVTKPGLVLDGDGICQACRNYEKRKPTNWTERYKHFEELSQRYKRYDGHYDCVIAVSGGKDSHFQVYVMKKLLGMNPLLVAAVDPFTKTEAGKHNLDNMCKAFCCDLLILKMNPEMVRRMVRIAFEEFGSPTWPIDRAIYVYPIRMAVNMGIPLVVYGENVSYEYGGIQQQETYSAKEQIKNDIAKNVDFNLWLKNGISKSELNMLIYPSQDEIEKAALEAIYLSYFLPWDGYKNYLISKRYGFMDLSHEWKREGYIEDYDQIDSIGYLLNVWMKYPKFGFSRATDVVGYWIRSGRISREEGIELIRNNDYKLDRKVLDDFLSFTGYTHEEFWNIVEKFWNREIFVKRDGQWQSKLEISRDPVFSTNWPITDDDSENLHDLQRIK